MQILRIGIYPVAQEFTQDPPERTFPNVQAVQTELLEHTKQSVIDVHTN